MSVIKILLIQADKEISSGLKHQIWELEYDTVETRSVKQGISQLEANSEIELVICDANFQSDSGLSFLNFINRTPKFYFVPVIISSSGCDMALIKKYLEFGAKDILLVPTNSETLKLKIENGIKNGKPNVLLVDHGNVLLSHLKYMVKLEGFNVVTANDADSAMQKINEMKISAVVSNIDLPNISGSDLMVKIKEHDHHMPVILLADDAQEYNAEEILASGADGFLSKPFRNLEISNLLRRYIMRKHKVLVK